MSVRVHPSAVVGAGVELGERVTVGPHVVLTGPLTLGDDCWVGAGTVLGSPPEIAGAPHPGDPTALSPFAGVHVGAGTVVRELCAVNQGSAVATTLGRGCYVMNRVFVGHDCVVGDRAVLSAGTSLGGHVTVGDAANLGLNCAVHQRRTVGGGAMVGMSSTVTRDVPPFALAHGSPARVHGANVVGLRRLGVDDDAAARLAAAYAAGDPGAPAAAAALAGGPR